MRASSCVRRNRNSDGCGGSARAFVAWRGTREPVPDRQHVWSQGAVRARGRSMRGCMHALATTAATKAV